MRTSIFLVGLLAGFTRLAFGAFQLPENVVCDIGYNAFGITIEDKFDPRVETFETMLSRIIVKYKFNPKLDLDIHLLETIARLGRLRLQELECLPVVEAEAIGHGKIKMYESESPAAVAREFVAGRGLPSDLAPRIEKHLRVAKLANGLARTLAFREKEDQYGPETMYPLLSAVYHQRSPAAKPSLILDIGANNGQSSWHLLQFFSDLATCQLAERLNKQRLATAGEVNTYHESCPETPRNRYLAFEPLPTNVKIMEGLAEAEGWRKVGFIPVAAAVGNRSGTVNFYSTTDRNSDEHASLSASAVETNTVATPVTLVSLNDFYESQDLLGEDRAFETFLIKIDAEGYDAEVIEGMGRLLERRAVKFFVFEYLWKWRTEGRTANTLRAVTRTLWERHDFACFIIHRDYLVPLFGRWWVDHDLLELFHLHNVMCAHRADPDLARIVRMHTVGPLPKLPDFGNLAEWIVEDLVGAADSAAQSSASVKEL